MSKQRILRDIDKVYRAIESERETYVCIAAMDTASENEIISMVQRHLGGAWSTTMQSFLAVKFKCQPEEISEEVRKSYRLCMLRNMKEMVRKEYK